MKVNLVEKVSKTELDELKRMIGEAFVTNELFHEFGDIDSRRALVMKYMDIYTEVPLVKDTTLQPTLTQYFTKTIYG